jgi:hypothetical protein
MGVQGGYVASYPHFWLLFDLLDLLIIILAAVKNAEKKTCMAV